VEGTDKGHEDAEGMALVGVRLTDQLGHTPLLILAVNFLRFWERCLA
jgi:hypothetical protein